MRLEGRGGHSGGHPISGLPEIGSHGAQVGQTRLAVIETTRCARLLTMRAERGSAVFTGKVRFTMRGKGCARIRTKTAPARFRHTAGSPA